MAKMDVIAIEEHFWTPELRAAAVEQVRNPKLAERLADLGALRIREMDEAGIDFQILSEAEPAAQGFDAEMAVAMARRSNDTLHAAMRAYPDRLGGFAALPTIDANASADELERTVTKLGFKGAMIMGMTQGQYFFDEKRFWPIYERAAALDVPLYLHPGTPPESFTQTYFGDYPVLGRAALGFTLDTMAGAVRIVMSGVLDKYPNLRIILGHLGEAIPFLLWRIDNGISRQVQLPRSFMDAFREHFYLTTSGAFSNSALTCSIAEMGVERILFSVDYPFQPNTLGMAFMNAAPVSETDRMAILSGNAKKLLRL
jgi:predicted TIM-barrel fold metal-dependent hydrolase